VKEAERRIDAELTELGVASLAVDESRNPPSGEQAFKGIAQKAQLRQLERMAEFGKQRNCRGLVDPFGPVACLVAEASGSGVSGRELWNFGMNFVDLARTVGHEELDSAWCGIWPTCGRMPPSVAMLNRDRHPR
jgi:hypothetical protein